MNGEMRKDCESHEIEVKEEKIIESTSTLIQLPVVVLIRILKLLLEDFNSLRNLSYTCKCLRSFILENIERLFIPHLDIDNWEVLRDANFDNDIDFKKRILSLKVTTSHQQTARISVPLGTPGFLEKHILQGKLFLDKSFFEVLIELNKTNLKSLEIRTNFGHSEYYSGVLQKILLPASQNYSESLEILKIDVILTNLQKLYSRNRARLDHFENFVERLALKEVFKNFKNFLDRLLQNAVLAELRRNPEINSLDAFKVFKELEINLIPEPDCDWFFYLEMPMNCWSEESFDERQEKLWRELFRAMIFEFETRVHINENYTRRISVKGIPFFFFDIVLEEVYYSLEEATYDWKGTHDKFGIFTERNGRFFDMTIKFY